MDKGGDNLEAASLSTPNADTLLQGFLINKSVMHGGSMATWGTCWFPSWDQGPGPGKV